MVGAEQQVKEVYVKTGQVRMVFNPVLNHGDRSVQAHLGAECAGEQGQFWEFREILFENQSALWGRDTRAAVKSLAATAGLDAARFDACMDEQRYLQIIQEQDAIRRTRGIRGQPFFDLNGDVYGGAAPFEAFAQVIDSILAE